MDFGFLSLLPPLVAIVLAVATRRVVLPLAAGVAVGAVVLAFGRVEVTTDFGTNNAVNVRFVASSPWFSATNKRLVFEQNDGGELRSPEVYVWGHETVIRLNTTAGSESTVRDLFEALEEGNYPVRAIAPEDAGQDYFNTPIATSLPNGMEILDFEAKWGPGGYARTNAGRRLSRSLGAFMTTIYRFLLDLLNSAVIFFTAIYESIFSILAIRDGVVPPTLNLDNPAEGCDIDLVPHQAKERLVRAALTNSFGFGGTNASIVFKAYE